MKKKIAIVGARGINNYGGFETAVGHIAPALVREGFEVYCSCEKNETNNPETYDGVNLIYFPIKMPSNYFLRQFLEIFYDIYFNIYCTVWLRCDIVYSLGVGANIFILFPRLFGKKSIVNVDGLEWRRSKFSKIQKFLLKFIYYSAILCANNVIVDNKALKNYINPRFLKKTIYIPYGVDQFELISWDQEKIGLKISANDYWLVVARLEPENNIHIIIKGYINSSTKKPLVIIGDFATKKYEYFIKKILKEKHPEKRIIFTKGIYDREKLNMLRQNCFAYIHGHSVGGTNPSLLEAMIMKNIIIAHDNEFNREVAGETVIYFRNAHDLKTKINEMEIARHNFLKLKIEAYIRVQNKFMWNNIVEDYNKLFGAME